MVKCTVFKISNKNDFKILKLPNGDYAPLETTAILNLNDVIYLENSYLGYVSFSYKDKIYTGSIEDYCSLDIALTFL